MHHSAISRARKDVSRRKLKAMGDHKAFLSRIKKSLYYGKLPDTERFSLPVSEIAAEIFSKIKNGKSLDRLDIEEAADLSRNACVSPCSLVLALLYLERLKTCNTEYLQRVAPSELFLVSMMIASKFLHDDGEEDEVFNDEWATSAGLDVKEVNRFEKDFLQAIGWEVFVSEQAFWNRLQELEKDVALREGKRRGWFSYSDLDHILEMLDLTTVAQTVISVSAVCLTSYTASVLTLIGSAFIVSQIPGSSISSSISSISNNRLTPVQPLAEETQSLPVSSVLDEAETNSIVSSLSSCAGRYASLEELKKINEKDNAHNSSKFRDYTNPWHLNLDWNSALSHYSKCNQSCEDTIGKETNIVSFLNKLLVSEENIEGNFSNRLFEWLLWARTWLELPSAQGIQQTGYLPVEVSVS
ncbi:Uncharacterized protein GBIM_16688 [Gryllus bimaculatus]|nr:Uncharacterized protein GBIM_16688 [Gryllus bimaculatus]